MASWRRGGSLLLALFALAGCKKPKRADVVHVSLSEGAACFTLKDGEVRCTGDALGSPPRDAERVAVAADVACARVKGDEVLCWKRGAEPVKVSASGTKPVAQETRVCYIDRTGAPTVKCVDGSLTPKTEERAPVGATTMCLGPDYGCAIKPGGAACWGALAATAMENPTDITCGAKHACARLASGRVSCWGEGASGEIAGLNGVADVCATSTSTCARLQSGLIACWSGAAAPAVHRGVFGASELACSQALSLVVTHDGALYAWGMDPKRLMPQGRESMPVPTPIFLRR